MRIAIPILVLALMGCQSRPGGRTITVAQSGSADVVGSDNVALQKAADMLKPGDTLAIGVGTYTMDNSVFIPSNVTVRGTPGKTILLKSAGVASDLIEDGDYGESQLLVAEPGKFRPGMGITVLDDKQSSGWDVSVTAVKSIDGNTMMVGPLTVRDYNLEQDHARIQNTFPILCVMDGENTVLEDIIVDGNKDQNAHLDGCRGGAIYIYKAKNVTVRHCVARNYNGDGISFQITDGVKILECESYGNTGLGIHPGTGSPRATVKACRTHHNGQIGLFLCWRVRHGEFSDNVIEDNGQYGISIGHKDTDNIFVNNTVQRNGIAGVYFRRETFKNSGHRNTFRKNRIIDNGNAKEGYGFLVDPYAGDIVIEENVIAETRRDQGTQRFGVYKVKGAGAVKVERNEMKGHLTADYREGESGDRSQ